MKTINVVLDSQQLNALQSCAARYNNRFNLHLVKKGDALADQKSAKDKGSLGHTLMKYYYSALKRGADWDVAASAAVQKGKMIQVESSLAFEESELVIDAFIQYIDHFKNEVIEVVAVENPFIKYVGEFEFRDNDGSPCLVKVYYNGLIDLLTNTSNWGDGVAFDHKTSSRDSELHDLNNQFIGYAFATERNVVIVNKLGLQTSKNAKDKFTREAKHYESDHIEYWKSLVIWWTQQYLFYVQNSTYPENYSSCNTTADGQYVIKCEYSEVCKQAFNPAAKKWILERDFEIGKIWDPSAELLTYEKERAEFEAELDVLLGVTA